MSAEQPDRLSAAFGALNAARKESMHEKARKVQELKDRKTHFDTISAEIIMPTLKEIAARLKDHGCCVTAPENSNEFQFQIGSDHPNVLPWKFMIEFELDKNFVHVRYSDPRSTQREMSITDTGVDLSEISVEWVREEAENFVIDVTETYTQTVQKSTD